MTPSAAFIYGSLFGLAGSVFLILRLIITPELLGLIREHLTHHIEKQIEDERKDEQK